MLINLFNKLGKDVKNSILALFIKLLAGISGYLLFVVIAQVSSSDEFGSFSLYFSFAMMIGLFANLGQNTFILKEIEKAKINSENMPSKIYLFSIVMTTIGVVLGSVIWLIITFKIGLFSVYLYCSGAAFILAYSFSQTTLGILRVNEKTLYAIFTRDFLWRLISILIVIVLSFFALKDDILIAEDFLMIMAIVLNAIVILHVFKIRQITKEKWTVSKATLLTLRNREWITTSVGLSLIAFISSSDSYLFNIVSSAYIGKTELGALFASVKTIELISIFLMAVTLVMSKDFSSLVAKKDTLILQRKCNLAIFLQALPVVFCFLVIFIFADNILAIFDNEYTKYSELLRVMSIGMLINSLTGSTVLLMQLADMHWRHIILQGTSIVLGCILIPVFVDFWGSLGVGYAYIVSKLTWNISALYCIRKRLNIDPSIFALILNTNGCIKYLKSDLLNIKGVN
jgi:O-antigen/teichoic acid export membrane protein